jgi:thiamine pyrophosphokinase
MRLTTFAASFIICADGGANQLYDMTLKFGKEYVQVRSSSLIVDVIRRAKAQADSN